MSYINEALKKAQKDKDTSYKGYMYSIGRSGSTKRTFNKKYIYFIVIIICLLALFIYLLLRGRVEQTNDNPGQASVNMTVKGKVQGNTNIPAKDNKNLQEEGKREHVKNETDMIRQRERLYKQAVSFLKEKRIREAEETYKKILTQDPGHINALNDMGALSLHKGKYKDAINYLEKAVKLKPKFVTPYYNLACAYSMQNEGDKGMTYLLKAIEVDEKVKEWAKEDPDLKNLREYAEFTIITK